MLELLPLIAGGSLFGLLLFYLLCRLATAAYFKSLNGAKRQ